MAHIVNVRNWKVLTIPQNYRLLQRAVDSLSLAAPGGFDATAPEFYSTVTSDDKFMLMGFENGAPKAVAMGFFPESALFPYPTITLIYNEGSRAVLTELKEALFDTITERGYSTAWAFNGTRTSDAAWIKHLVPERAEGHVIGSVIEIGVK